MNAYSAHCCRDSPIHIALPLNFVPFTSGACLYLSALKRQTFAMQSPAGLQSLTIPTWILGDFNPLGGKKADLILGSPFFHICRHHVRQEPSGGEVRKASTLQRFGLARRTSRILQLTHSHDHPMTEFWLREKTRRY